jgi:hypothetical protein
VLLSHAAYGAAAAAIDSDAGPIHGALVKSAITELYDDAAKFNSAPSASQATDAATNDSGPGPAYIRPELISGGNAPKSNTQQPLCQQAAHTRAGSAAVQEPASRGMVEKRS